jgi:signal transduction histidine kinase
MNFCGRRSQTMRASVYSLGGAVAYKILLLGLDEAALNQFRPATERTHYRLRLAHMHASSPRLTQALINLVGDAIKFTDTGEVAIKAGANDGSFHASVRDTGPGVSAADQAKLFQEFQ